jgi:hypothetical protein
MLYFRCLVENYNEGPGVRLGSLRDVRILEDGQIQLSYDDGEGPWGIPSIS